MATYSVEPIYVSAIQGCGMIIPEAFLLVSTTLWETPNRMREFFVVPITAITDTDQRTAKRQWITMKTRETNDNNVNTCLVIKFEHVIPQVYHTGGTEMGRDDLVVSRSLKTLTNIFGGHPCVCVTFQACEIFPKHPQDM